MKDREPVYSVRCFRKRIALTFDDGYQHTRDILEKLEHHRVKATFFMVGDWIKQEPELCRMVSEAGHEVGNHGFSHHDMTTLSEVEAREEIRRGQELIREAAGKDCGLFRFPYGASDAASLRLVAEQGLRAVGWSVDSADWTGIDAKTICSNILDSGHLEKGAIVLMHTTHLQTAEALDRLIPALREQGYRFVKVSELLASLKHRLSRWKYMIKK